MPMLRATLEISQIFADDVALQRPQDAPVQVELEVEDEETLFSIGRRMRDALAIPEGGYPPYWYVANFSLPEDLPIPETSRVAVPLIQGSPEGGASPSEVLYLARSDGSMRWHTPSSELTYADLAYSQGVGLVPEGDTVEFFIGTGAGGLGLDPISWDQWVQVVTGVGQFVASVYQILQARPKLEEAGARDLDDVAELANSSPASSETLSETTGVPAEAFDAFRDTTPEELRALYSWLSGEQRQLGPPAAEPAGYHVGAERMSPSPGTEASPSPTEKRTRVLMHGAGVAAGTALGAVAATSAILLGYWLRGRAEGQAWARARELWRGRT